MGVALLEELCHPVQALKFQKAQWGMGTLFCPHPPLSLVLLEQDVAPAVSSLAIMASDPLKP